MHVANLMPRPWLAVAIIAALLASSEARAQEKRPSRQGPKYKVRIDSAPQQAAIYLDDVKYGIVGYTPWTGELEAGEWKVILKRESYQDGHRTMKVARSDSLQETFIPMVRIEDPASIEVRADADASVRGAELWVSGELKGQVPMTLKLADGRYLVEIKRSGFETFSQWVTTKKGERVTLNPVLKKDAPAGVGALLIEADVRGAEVWVDGNLHDDRTPTQISNLPAGPHQIEVRKPPGKSWTQTIHIYADQTVKVRATLGNAAPKGGMVNVVSNVDGAQVFLDGRLVGTAPTELADIPAGEHSIEVKAPGYASRSERVVVAAGSRTVLTLDLDSAESPKGTLKVVSPTIGAEVFVDGRKLGVAPQVVQVTAGDHTVVVSKNGFATHEEVARVMAGQMLTVTAKLEAESAGPGAAVDVEGTIDADSLANDEEADLQAPNPTSFGARALPRGRSTIDFATGYPYYFDGGVTIGAGGEGTVGYDMGVIIRSYFTRSDLAVKGRVTLLDQDPFSVGLFGDLGIGAALFSRSQRRGVFGDLGAAASISGLGSVTLTFRGYLNWWRDRHCPELDEMGGFPTSSDPIEECEDYLRGRLPPAEMEQIDEILGGPGEVFEPDWGARFMTSFIAEVALKKNWNFFFLFEGAPFQGERAAFIDAFYAPMFDSDPATYFRLGFTYKF